ncbi:MAG: hypothetical protein HC905_03535 [Bacteroidales bacterium]|nr:hypothetical protein [Bacteroidales bacterium]
MLIGRIEANNTLLGQEKLTISGLADKIKEQLQVSGKTLEEVQEILKWKPDLKTQREIVQKFRRDLDFASRQATSFRTIIGDQHFNEDGYNQLLMVIKELTQTIESKNRLTGKMEADLARLKADFEKTEKLKILAASLDIRLENIKTLKQLFKGSGFVNYISTVYLRDLCHFANERFFKLSGQKLSLEVTEDNSFEVRDFMNGGKTRNVKTLSGGQTFQAALSLALALSDNTRKESGHNENFFFLDEGFGSLDKKSLDVVFDTLKSLRRENRTVGIISHVEEMQQEIDIHLRVENHEDRGSIVEKSWESSKFNN